MFRGSKYAPLNELQRSPNERRSFPKRASKLPPTSVEAFPNEPQARARGASRCSHRHRCLRFAIVRRLRSGFVDSCRSRFPTLPPRSVNAHLTSVEASPNERRSFPQRAPSASAGSFAMQPSSQVSAVRYCTSLALRVPIARARGSLIPVARAPGSLIPVARVRGSLSPVACAPGFVDSQSSCLWFAVYLMSSARQSPASQLPRAGVDVVHRFALRLGLVSFGILL